MFNQRYTPMLRLRCVLHRMYYHYRRVGSVIHTSERAAHSGLIRHNKDGHVAQAAAAQIGAPPPPPSPLYKGGYRILGVNV